MTTDATPNPSESTDLAATANAETATNTETTANTPTTADTEATATAPTTANSETAANTPTTANTETAANAEEAHRLTEELPAPDAPTEVFPETASPSEAPADGAPTRSLPAEPWLTPPPPADWTPAPAASRAPIRWGGVVWGLLLVLFAGGMLFVLSAPERLAAVEVWLAALTPGSAWALWLAAAGVLIVVFALLGAIRSAQRRRHAV